MRQAFARIAGLVHLVTVELERGNQHTPEVGLILDDEDPRAT